MNNDQEYTKLMTHVAGKHAYVLKKATEAKDAAMRDLEDTMNESGFPGTHKRDEDVQKPSRREMKEMMAKEHESDSPVRLKNPKKVRGRGRVAGLLAERNSQSEEY